MAYATESLRITYGFTVSGSDEVAQTGWHWGGDSTFDAAAALAELDDGDLDNLISDMYGVMSGTTGIRWAYYSNLAWVKVAAVGTDGDYLAEPKIHEEAMGHGAGEDVLLQSSIVASLRSGATLGRGNRGRMYLPHTSSGFVSHSFKIDPTYATNIATAVAGLLEDANTTLNSAITQAGLPVILSGVGSGITRSIQEVWVGNIVDTQRRRRAQVDEAYVTQEVSYS